MVAGPTVFLVNLLPPELKWIWTGLITALEPCTFHSPWVQLQKFFYLKKVTATIFKPAWTDLPNTAHTGLWVLQAGRGYRRRIPESLLWKDSILCRIWRISDIWMVLQWHPSNLAGGDPSMTLRKHSLPFLNLFLFQVFIHFILLARPSLYI